MSAISTEDDLNVAQAEEARANAVAHSALAELRAAQARKALAEALDAEHHAAISRITRDEEERAERENKARDYFNHVYQFDGAVAAPSVRSCISLLTSWSRLDPDCDITIIFNSPGGSVIDGFALWDFLATLKREGHHLTTICRGMAASMAGILLQAGDKRVIGSESVLLVHEISFGAGGKIGEVEDEVAFAKMLTQRVLKIFAAKTKLTAKQIDTKWKRKDWWMDSDEALKLGFADEIA
jgi:ATP-dependent Clp endopeptidase proteolytic subunit ClpP